MKTIFQRTEITEPALFTAFDTTKKIEDFPKISFKSLHHWMALRK